MLTVDHLFDRQRGTVFIEEAAGADLCAAQIDRIAGDMTMFSFFDDLVMLTVDHLFDRQRGTVFIEEAAGADLCAAQIDRIAGDMTMFSFFGGKLNVLCFHV